MLFSKNKPLVGLDVGSRSIKAVELAKSKSGYEIVDFGSQALPPDIVVHGAITDAGSVSDVRQVHGLGNIPVLGHLFKSTQVIKSTSELLFFITAWIKPTNPLECLPTSPEGQSEEQGGTGPAPPEGIQQEPPCGAGRFF